MRNALASTARKWRGRLRERIAGFAAVRFVAELTTIGALGAVALVVLSDERLFDGRFEPGVVLEGVVALLLVVAFELVCAVAAAGVAVAVARRRGSDSRWVAITAGLTAAVIAVPASLPAALVWGEPVSLVAGAALFFNLVLATLIARRRSSDVESARRSGPDDGDSDGDEMWMLRELLASAGRFLRGTLKIAALGGLGAIFVFSSTAQIRPDDLITYVLGMLQYLFVPNIVSAFVFVCGFVFQALCAAAGLLVSLVISRWVANASPRWAGIAGGVTAALVALSASGLVADMSRLPVGHVIATFVFFNLVACSLLIRSHLESRSPRKVDVPVQKLEGLNA